LEDPRPLVGLEVEPIHPRPRPLGVPARARLARARQEYRLSIAADDDFLLAIRPALHLQRATCHAVATGTSARSPPTPAEAAARGHRYTVVELEPLGWIGRVDREHRASVGAEHRLAVAAERDRSETPASGVDLLRVVRTVRRQPTHELHRGWLRP